MGGFFDLRREHKPKKAVIVLAQLAPVEGEDRLAVAEAEAVKVVPGQGEAQRFRRADTRLGLLRRKGAQLRHRAALSLLHHLGRGGEAPFFDEAAEAQPVQHGVELRAEVPAPGRVLGLQLHGRFTADGGKGIGHFRALAAGGELLRTLSFISKPSRPA